MHIRSWAIGLFLILGVGFFTAILFLIGDQQKAFGKHLVVYAEFTNLAGLPVGAKVRVSGLDAGEVKKIEIPSVPSGKFRLELQLEDKVRGMIRSDSLASIQTAGLVGDEFLFIKKGTDTAPALNPGSTLPSKEPLDLAALLENGSGLLNDVHNDINDIHGRADLALKSITTAVHHTDDLVVEARPNITTMLSSGNHAVGQVDGLVSDLNRGRGSAGLLLRDEATRTQIQDTLSNVQQTSTNLNQSSLHVKETVADFQSRELPEKASASLDNVQALSLQLNTAVQQALAEDDIGEDGASNIRQTLSSLNRSTTNLAEDTEALKHNFFLRGFFKKRGFFNLDEVTEREYRAASERHMPGGTRLWVEASDFAMSGGDLHEQLTPGGRAQIDSAIAPYVGTLSGEIIMVEGYSVAGIPDEAYLLERARADLVRRYLETHYHLRHDDLGIVPLGSHPPKGADRGDWDGAAIMLMRLPRR